MLLMVQSLFQVILVTWQQGGGCEILFDLLLQSGTEGKTVNCQRFEHFANASITVLEM